MLSNKKFSNHPLLVTGAAGFVGSRFAQACADRGQEVICVDRTGYFSERSEIRATGFGTIVDRDQLFDWLKREKPALGGIVHLGACANTMETDEAFLFRNNVEYSQRLWNHARELGIPFIYASSAATYGDGSEGYDDDEARISRLKPLNLYGNSKHLFDLWALEQERQGSHPPQWAGFKFFNVYGFGERHKKNMASVVLHAYEQIRATHAMKLFRSHREGVADGHQSRDFVFVDDVINVLFFALAKPIRRGIFNLGTGKARPFVELARATFAAMKQPEKIEFIDTPLSIRDKYQYFTQAKMDKLKAEGYTRAFTDLDTGVRSYVSRLQAGR
jgi:ADP-L-glycero-D-manno-heptose 6-epimerase